MSSSPAPLTLSRPSRQARRTAWDAALRTAEQAAVAAGAHLLGARSRLGLAFLDRRTPGEQAARVRDEAHALAADTIRRAFPAHALVARHESGLVRPSTEQGPVWLLDVLDGEGAYLGDRPGWAVSVALAIDGDLRLGIVHDPVEGVTCRAIAGQGAQVDGRPADPVPAPPAADTAPGGDVATLAAVAPAATVRRPSVIRTAPCRRLSSARIAARFPTPGSSAMVVFSPEFGRASQAAPGVQRYAATALALAHLACGRIDAFWTRDHDPCSSAAGLLIAREAGATLRGRDGLPALRTRSLAVSTPDLSFDFHAMLAGL